MQWLSSRLLQPVSCGGFMSIRKLKFALVCVIVILRLAITYPPGKYMNVKKEADCLHQHSILIHTPYPYERF